MLDKTASAFEHSLAAVQHSVDARLAKALPSKDDATADLIAAMRHSVFAGGKRMRAYLVMHSAALFDVPPDVAVTAAAAIECLHAYSLVHDDLPCMDDDDLRRGQPTVHVKWDEATAVLVGDALQTLAFELLTKLGGSVSDYAALMLVRRLAEASGTLGMVGGQAMDIAAETAPTPLDLTAIRALQARKTGALLIWSAEAGAILGAATDAERDALVQYASALGLAFQIQDDLLDVEGNVTAMGKRVGKDSDAGKATFVSLLGQDGARAQAKALIDEAIDHLSCFGISADPLRQIAEFTIHRTR